MRDMSITETAPVVDVEIIRADNKGNKKNHENHGSFFTAGGGT